jgi:hypothetical protein
MITDFVAYPSLAFLAAMMTVTLIERRRDVLYGPYIQGRKTAFAAFRDELDAFLAVIGLGRGYGRMTVKFAGVSILASAIIG